MSAKFGYSPPPEYWNSRKLWAGGVYIPKSGNVRMGGQPDFTLKPLKTLKSGCPVKSAPYRGDITLAVIPAYGGHHA